MHGSVGRSVSSGGGDRLLQQQSTSGADAVRGHPDPVSASGAVDLPVPSGAALQVRLGALGDATAGPHPGPRATDAAGAGHPAAEPHRGVGRSRQVRARLQSNRLEDRPAARTQRG